MKKTILSILALTLTMQGVSTYNVLAENDNPLNIDFGIQLTKQETEGYAALSGTTYERFEQAKAELPDEVPVIGRISVTGQNVFYVDNNGSDLNNGLSTDAPFKTINRALEAVQALSDTDKSNGTVIYVRGGEYYISEKAEIMAEHCSDTAALFISAYNGENVTFTTSEAFGSDKLKQITEQSVGFASYVKLPYDTRRNGYYVDYTDIGVGYIATDTNITEGASKLTLARYPNAGYDAVKDVINGGYGSTSVWIPMMDEAFDWVDTGEIHVYGKFAYEWEFCDSIVKIDKSTGYLHGTGSLSHRDGPLSKYLKGPGTSMYYYYNIMEELDVPGEWFADNTSKRLYIYPLSENLDDLYNICSDGEVFSLSNAKNVVIDGININGAKKAIYVSDSKNTVIQNCKIENIATSAVDFVNTEKCGIINSRVSGVDYKPTLISISESIAKKTQLYPKRNFVQNNIIMNGRTAVSIATIGNIMSHNLIKSTANSAVGFTGAENIIEYNEFSGVQKLVGDSGGTYTGVSFLIRNNHVRYNYIHDSKYNKRSGRAIYLDDCGDGNFAYGNVIKNYGYGIFIHGGSSNVVEDNTVIDVREPITNAYDYAVNGINDTQMQDRFLVKGDIVAGYVENGYDKSETWQTRYNTALTDKYDEVTQAKELFASLGTEQEAVNKVKAVTNYKASHANVPYEEITGYADVKKCVDLIVDHDCWYINNKVVNCEKAAGYATAVGMNNVESDNQSLTVDDVDTYIYDNIDIFDGIGIVDTSFDTIKPNIHIRNGAVINPKDFNGFSWDNSDAASYYTVKVATDEEFNNVVVDYTTDCNEMSLYKFNCASADAEVQKLEECTYNDAQTGDTGFVIDKVYYAKVIASNNDNSLTSNSSESDVCTFTLSENDVPDNEWGMIQGNVSGYIQIEGSIPPEKTNKRVNIMIYDKSVDKAQLENDLSKIKQLVQTEADSKGNFSCRFKLDDCDLSTLNTAVRVGDNELAENEFTQMVQSFTEFTLDSSVRKVIDGDDIVTAIARANNKLGTMEKYTIIIAEYAEDGKLIGCIYDDYDVNDVNESESQYTVKENAEKVKVFAWSDLKPIIAPIANPGN